jgi:hypothetical protein
LHSMRCYHNLKLFRFRMVKSVSQFCEISLGNHWRYYINSVIDYCFNLFLIFEGGIRLIEKILVFNEGNQWLDFDQTRQWNVSFDSFGRTLSIWVFKKRWEKYFCIQWTVWFESICLNLQTFVKRLLSNTLQFG